MECLRISLIHICAKYRQTKLRGSESPTAVLPATTLGMGSQSYSILVLATTEQTCGWRFFFSSCFFFFFPPHLSLCFPCLLLLKRKNTHGLLWDWNEMNWRKHTLCNVQLYFLFDIVFWFFFNEERGEAVYEEAVSLYWVVQCKPFADWRYKDLSVDVQ